MSKDERVEQIRKKFQVEELPMYSTKTGELIRFVEQRVFEGNADDVLYLLRKIDALLTKLHGKEVIHKKK
jgi:uncharacterized protein YrrD